MEVTQWFIGCALYIVARAINAAIAVPILFVTGMAVVSILYAVAWVLSERR